MTEIRKPVAREIRRPAVRIRQGKRTLFFTSFTVREFADGGFYRVDHLDVKAGKGHQRLLDESRARSFAKDMLRANNEDETFLPTSVFLATEGTIEYDEKRGEMAFEPVVSGVLPFDVVDGQHRIEGLLLAQKSDNELKDFPISVVIAHEMTQPEKMAQFVIVNTKQKTVDTGVTQVITAKFKRILDEFPNNKPYLPSWLQRQVDKGTDDKALTLTMDLNKDERCPWYRKIQFADEYKQPEHTITQATFVRLAKQLLLTKSHPLFFFDEKKRHAILCNFWNVIDDICVGDEYTGSVVFKSTGVTFFHSILGPILNQLAYEREYSEEKFKKIMMGAAEHLPPNAVGCLSPDFWRPGSAISGYNRGAIAALSAAFTEALAAYDEDFAV